MGFPRSVVRSVRSSFTSEPCIFCQSRQLLRPVYHNGYPKLLKSSNWRAEAPQICVPRRRYATQRYDVQRMRKDIDMRARIGFYTLINRQGVLKMDANQADSIIADFLHQKNNMDHGENIQRLADKYQVGIEDLASLAIITFKIPEMNDPEKKAMLPPSQHKTVSGLLLQGCAQAEDPLAIVQILSAVYLSSSNPTASIRELARLFPQSEVAKYRKILEKLGAKAQSIDLGPDALTLQGLFLEREGQTQKAKALYEEALIHCNFKYEPGSRHPMQVNTITPWNALGFLLKSDKDPSVQAQAKNYFEQGALDGDDPLSYYELAAFEPRTSTKWLQYTSKAAASGHRQAMVDLANFYQEVNSTNSPILGSSKMRKALNWLRGWRRGSAATFAREWLQAAAKHGHKPSMLRLADYYEAGGEHEKAIEQLRQMSEPPSLVNQGEEWPQLAQLARKRLAGIRA